MSRKKKILDFLLLRSVLTLRNVTSFAIVGVFFGIYLLSGGRFGALPNVKPASGFGSVTLDVDESSKTSFDPQSPSPSTAQEVSKGTEEDSLAASEKVSADDNTAAPVDENDGQTTDSSSTDTAALVGQPESPPEERKSSTKSNADENLTSSQNSQKRLSEIQARLNRMKQHGRTIIPPRGQKE